MRLIDADKLKTSLPEPDNITQRWVYRTLCDFIDNAPTVFSCNACKNMGNEQECVDCHDYSNYVHYEERPKGEWIDYSNEGFVECPFCGSATNCEDNKEELHYCWNCGAKLN